MNTIRQLFCPTLIVHEVFGNPVDYLPHVDDTAQLSVALEGTLTDRGDDYCFEREPGSVTFRPAGTRHSVISHTPARGICIEIPPERFAQLYAHTDMDASQPVHLSGNELSGLTDQLYFELRRGDCERPLMVEALTMTLLARFATVLRRRNAEARPPWLDDALDLIRSECRIPNLSANDVAERLGIATADLNMALAHFERASLHELLQRYRVEWARQQLSASRRAIAAIAHEAGFYDNSHMVRAFRRLLGTTPSAYRRAYCRFGAAWSAGELDVQMDLASIQERDVPAITLGIQ